MQCITFEVPTNQNLLTMDRKINLFTLLIFAYSVIVCSICKKDEPNLLSSKNHFLLPGDKAQPSFEPAVKSNVQLSSLTASSSVQANLGQ